MAARPRRFDLGVKNLYCRRDNRNGEVYYQYRDPRNGRFFGLGKERDLAKERASSLNLLIAEQISESLMENIVNSNGTVKEASQASAITFGQWTEQYIEIQSNRHKSGEIRENTFKAKRNKAHQASAVLGNIALDKVTTKDCYELIKSYQEQDKSRLGHVIRSTLIDMYKEAAQAGEVQNGYNPATATKAPKVRIKRSRLSLDDFLAALKVAQTYKQPWVENSMLLAIVTGQRKSEIASARFRKGKDWDGLFTKWHEGNFEQPPYSFVEDDNFYIFQRKTGMMLCLPLSLRLDVLNMNLRDVISKCRNGVIAQNIIHHAKTTNSTVAGGDVCPDSLSLRFRGALNDTGREWRGNQPSFHEIRSLSERLYSEQGINTQVLLGHKSPNTTARYHDVRGHEWVRLII